jgi:hypothetical protein
MSTRTRGRPHKFGRPARLVALTLPEDTIDELHSIDRDLARAVVALVDRVHGRRDAGAERRESDSPVSLAHVSDQRALIVVDPQVLGDVPGCAVIPWSPGRAFLALEPGRTLADVELALGDILESGTDVARRAALAALRDALREFRRDDTLVFDTRSIVFVERTGGPTA